MGKKIVRCGMVGLIVLLFGFCQMAFAETYEGTLKFGGKWLDYDMNEEVAYKGNVNEKLNVSVSVNILGIMTVSGVSVDEEKPLIFLTLTGKAGDQAFRLRGTYTDADGSETSINVTGKLKINEKNQTMKLEGKYVGNSTDSVVNGPCNANVQVPEVEITE